MFPLNSENVCNSRQPEKYSVNFARTESYLNSAVPYCQRLLNDDHKQEQEKKRERQEQEKRRERQEQEKGGRGRSRRRAGRGRSRPGTRGGRGPWPGGRVDCYTLKYRLTLQ